MNYKLIGRFFAFVTAGIAVFMLPALLFCLCDTDTAGTFAFLSVMLACGLFAAVLFALCRGAGNDFFAKEGFVVVGASWLIVSLISAFPLFLSGSVPTYVDALFEMASGFSTTGASVIADVESLSRGMLYWRSFSHWLGGMGILVFLLAVVPVEGKNRGFTMHVLRAESPGPTVGKLVPKLRKTASILYLTYVVLTAVNFIFLLFGMSPFEALCTALGTAGTGGFGVKNDSLAGYSDYVQIVTTVFMLLFGVNFSLYYLILLGRLRAFFSDEELRAYVLIVAASIALITANLLATPLPDCGTFGDALRHAAFQVASVISTTGYSTTDFDLWPAFSKSILVFLMAIGACAGSTGGGFKISRFLILMKCVNRNIKQMIHSQKVETIRLGGKNVDEKVVAGTGIYFAAYMLIILSSFFIVSLDSHVGGDVSTSFTAVLACFNNIGPGLSGVGPTKNFADFSALSKLVLVFDMLAGRLEIYPMLILLSPRIYRKA